MTWAIVLKIKFKLVYGQQIWPSFSLLNAIRMAVSEGYSAKSRLDTVGVSIAEEMNSGERGSKGNQTVAISVSNLEAVLEGHENLF